MTVQNRPSLTTAITHSSKPAERVAPPHVRRLAAYSIGATFVGVGIDLGRSSWTETTSWEPRLTEDAHENQNLIKHPPTWQMHVLPWNPWHNIGWHRKTKVVRSGLLVINLGAKCTLAFFAHIVWMARKPACLLACFYLPPHAAASLWLAVFLLCFIYFSAGTAFLCN